MVRGEGLKVEVLGFRVVLLGSLEAEMQRLADESLASAVETCLPTRKELKIMRDLVYCQALTKGLNTAPKHLLGPQLSR